MQRILSRAISSRMWVWFWMLSSVRVQFRLFLRYCPQEWQSSSVLLFLRFTSALPMLVTDSYVLWTCRRITPQLHPFKLILILLMCMLPGCVFSPLSLFASSVEIGVACGCCPIVWPYRRLRCDAKRAEETTQTTTRMRVCYQFDSLWFFLERSLLSSVFASYWKGILVCIPAPIACLLTDKGCIELRRSRSHHTAAIVL